MLEMISAVVTWYQFDVSILGNQRFLRIGFHGSSLLTFFRTTEEVKAASDFDGAREPLSFFLPQRKAQRRAKEQ